MRKLFFFIIALTLIISDEIHAFRSLPDDNLALPVLIELDNVSTKSGSGPKYGSGFYLNTGKSIYLVTAKHVLFDMDNGSLLSNKAVLLSYSKDPKEQGKNVIEVDLTALFETKRLWKHPTQDIATVNITSFENGNYYPVTGVKVLEKTKSGLILQPFYNMKRYEDVLIANTVYMLGYPITIGVKQIRQLDPLRPLLRFGIVAGKNQLHNTIIVDCPSYHGNSGGPIIELEEDKDGSTKIRIIGIVSQFVPIDDKLINPIANTGYTVIVPMDSVLDMISSQ